MALGTVVVTVTVCCSAVTGATVRTVVSQARPAQDRT
jgi:hypothetical protein